MHIQDTLAYMELHLDPNNPGEPLPPWLAFPEGEDPCWGGWRQGNGEGWLFLVWIPFFRLLSVDQRNGYLQKWNAPELAD